MDMTIDELFNEQGYLTVIPRGASREQAVQIMDKTIAEVLVEEGYRKGMERSALQTRRETLLRQLRLKFKRVPAAIKAEINATHDVKKLDDWLDEFATAKSLSAMRFSCRASST